MPMYATCAVINSIWGQQSPTPNSPFATRTPVDAMALALSDNTRVQEFFILNRDINAMKTTIMSWQQDTVSIPRLTGTWQELWQRIRTASLVFSYMRKAPVFDVFDDTDNRMITIIQAIDADPFYAQFGHPQPQNEIGGTVQHVNWEAAYNVWMSQFLRLKQFKMQAWVQDAVGRVIAGIQADQTLVQQQKDQLLNFVQTQASMGPPAGWMSEGAMSWGSKFTHMMSF